MAFSRLLETHGKEKLFVIRIQTLRTIILRQGDPDGF